MTDAAHPIPGTLLLDLDDTILDDTGNVKACWRTACDAHETQLGTVSPSALYEAIQETSAWYWADAERHRVGRLDLAVARRRVVEMALETLRIADLEIAAKVAERYAHERHQGMRPFDDAIDTVRWFRARGCRLGLLTNGNAEAQRNKVQRFELASLFDTILIEGELGYGKPDPRVYRRALDGLGATAADTWMVGDNLDWDVAGAQSVGIAGIWVDRHGAGVPVGHAVRPDRIIRALSELRAPAT